MEALVLPVKPRSFKSWCSVGLNHGVDENKNRECWMTMQIQQERRIFFSEAQQRRLLCCFSCATSFFCCFSCATSYYLIVSKEHQIGVLSVHAIASTTRLPPGGLHTSISNSLGSNYAWSYSTTCNAINLGKVLLLVYGLVMLPCLGQV